MRGCDLRSTILITMDKSKQKEGSANTAGRLASLVGKWFSTPGPLIPCFFGFAFMRAYNDLAARSFSEAFFEQAWWGEDLYTLVLLAVFLFGALAARRIAPLYDKFWPTCLAIALAMLCAVLIGFGSQDEVLYGPCLAIAIVSGGVAGSLFILLWAELHSCLEPLAIVTYVSGAFLFGTIGSWVLQELTGTRLALVMLILPIVSFLCLKASFARIAPVDLPRRSWGRYHFPWRLIIVLGVYEFAYGVREGAPSFQWDAYPVGVAAVAFSVFLLACFCFRKVDFVFIYRTPFALMVCGLATVPATAALGAFVSDALVSAGYALMFLVLTFLLCDLSHRYGVSVLVLCGVQELTAAFRLLGHQVPQAVASGTLPGLENETLLPAALTVVVVLASGLLFIGHSSKTPWGAAFFGVGAMVHESDEHSELVRRCASLAEAHGLSAREHEVLELVALGRSPVQIERELVIANGTLKSHMRRIYQKLGIHSKKELRAMVGTDGQVR